VPATLVALCPEIHTYSHMQQFTKIKCVIPTLPSQRERSHVAGLDPNADGNQRRLSEVPPMTPMSLTKSEGPRDVKWMVDQPLHTSHKLQRIL
jgi:hypothetical protein